MVISRERKQQHKQDLIGEGRRFQKAGIDYTKLTDPKKKKKDKQQKKLI